MKQRKFRGSPNPVCKGGFLGVRLSVKSLFNLNNRYSRWMALYAITGGTSAVLGLWLCLVGMGR